MFCILSFQGLLNFGNSCIYREVLSNLKSAVAATRFFEMRTLFIIYRGVDIKEKGFSAQRIILANFEIVLNIFEQHPTVRKFFVPA